MPVLIAALVLTALSAITLETLSSTAQAQPSVQEQLTTPPPAGLRDHGSDWQREKCERYQKAWMQAKTRRGTTGLSPDFLTRHDAFIASGCLEGRNVCPRSREELDIANTLVLLGMNAGMSGTFFPFACKAAN